MYFFGCYVENRLRGVRAKAVRLVKRLQQQFRPEMIVTWVRAVVMETVRSGQILGIFKM